MAEGLAMTDRNVNDAAFRVNVRVSVDMNVDLNVNGAVYRFAACQRASISSRVASFSALPSFASPSST